MNNAGVSGVIVDEDGLRALNIDPASWVSKTIYAPLRSEISYISDYNIVG